MTFAGAIFLIVAGLVGLVLALIQFFVLANRARRADPRYDEPRY